uniref:Presequence protease, mitochondrial n=1 Tax=Schistosoma haematobium TaxID=6185 RepID=A0A095CF15_SCHHA
MIGKVENLAANKLLYGFRLKRVSVQLRTVPHDDSGVSHILEHTVLCGSQKYPCRDPFMKMTQRSQATFMNAFTGKLYACGKSFFLASDWTMYPFSTMNNTDFQNLLKVYLDAVFRPKIEELDFMQEGWRLEPENLNDMTSNLVLKGVVFNEMKGVFSNSLNRFAQTIKNKLFPQTYGFVSAGSPERIPTLTYEYLKEFHNKYYHPSNSCFYTYGNVNLEQCLDYLDSEYLQHYDFSVQDNSVPLECIWDEPRLVQLTCEPDPMNPHPDRECCVSLSFRLDDICDVYKNFVLGIVCNLLLNGDNTPLYRGLIESGYGLDWIDSVSGIDRGTRTTSFHVGVQGVRANDLENFPHIINDILSEVVRDGFPIEEVEATLHQYELEIRHESARFGLNLILNLSNAVNHGVDLNEFLKIGANVDRFRQEWTKDPAILQNFVQQFFLDNKHKLTTVMRPDPNWKSIEAKKDEEHLDRLTKNITPLEREKLALKARQLLEKQNQEEDVSCLPCLDIFDVPLECRPEPFTLTQTSDFPVQLNEAATNGLVYFHALADLKDLPCELLSYVPLFCSLFTRLGADGMSYSEMSQAIELHTGGFDASPFVTPKIPSCSKTEFSSASRQIHLSSYCLESKIPNFFELWSKLFRSPDWSDQERLSTLIQMSAAGEWSANAISDSAHEFAMCRAAASLSSTRLTHELWSGIEQARIMQHIAGEIGLESDKRSDVLSNITERMKAIWSYITSHKRLKFSLHGEADGLMSGLKYLDGFLNDLSQSPKVSNSLLIEDSQNPDFFPNISRNTFFAMPYTVHYVAKAIEAPSYDSEDYASYRVLAHLLSFKYLHREIREKGGAYGGGAIAKPEAFLFYSYRNQFVYCILLSDPYPLKTLSSFENAIKWASSREFQDQDIKEAKLSVFQELDYPVSAGSRGLTRFLNGISDDLRQSHRNQVFSVDASRIKDISGKMVQKLSDTSDFHNVGRVVIGPQSSPDWIQDTFGQDSKIIWERVIMMI